MDNSRSIGIAPAPAFPAAGTLLLAALAALVAWWLWSAPTVPGHLAEWAPALGAGLLANIRISIAAIGLGSVVGLVIGALQLSPLVPLRIVSRCYVVVFRNAPMLVLIYFASYVFPFELKLGGHYVAFPDWIKVTIGLALPASANVAEIFRGAIGSIPAAQWEAATSLAFRRAQIFRWVVLPQCAKRMLPPWMNLYASITMATSLASLVGVHDLLDTAQIASTTVNRVDFTVTIYLTTLALFFIYCYPISRLTQRLERKYAFE
ncbi:amino acid ABC transporter permease [Noviherbaspirillum sp. L7-7A]|uniref:amino acid ABC transporter permease n=1 Tax=Noviherbaspirillum sp. L7-7A TaxID=2850560 RepID=UPI001C2BA5F9|nr:amino acid ABC transporter permease [Noviherbaspirillum sp. L7-7A]MBV0882145.1 amino acid ABC transporter permease [Noviherbaspirillum sp. L7-7A]